MKKAVIISIAYMLLLIYLVPTLEAQNLDEILARNFETRGGQDKLKEVKSLICNGKMVVNKINECPLTLWRLYPDKTKMEVNMMGRRLVQAYNGRFLWWINPYAENSKPEKQAKSDEDEFFETARPLCMDSLIRYKEARHTLEYLGREEMEGTPVFKLKLTERKDKSTLFYLDAETGVELKTVTCIVKGKGYMEYACSLGDYQEEGGLMFPFSMDFAVTTSDENKTIHMSLIVTRIELNSELKPKDFDMPVSKDGTGDAPGDMEEKIKKGEEK
ncbi:MAG: hypothetical protein ABIK28_20125 [Planctomycetota bacterium]